MFSKILGTVFAVLAVMLIYAVIVGVIVMWLWNAVVPEIFGLAKIGWQNAFLLTLLCQFLFKGSSYSSSKS